GPCVRQRIRRKLAELVPHEDTVDGLRAVARGDLARKHYRNVTKSLRKATPVLVGLQAREPCCRTRERKTSRQL
ncbi:hypothetical protein CALVIDRAFT_473444, partial [Calocera viscosa TUFC12733]